MLLLGPAPSLMAAAMAALSAALKFESAIIVLRTASNAEGVRPSAFGCPAANWATAPPTMEDDGTWSREAKGLFWACVRSSITVGNGAEAEMLTVPEAKGITGFINMLPLCTEPDNIALAAAEVAFAMVKAAGGSGWL